MSTSSSVTPFFSEPIKFKFPVIKKYFDGDYHINFLRTSKGSVHVVVIDIDSERFIPVFDSRGVSFDSIVTMTDDQVKDLLNNHYISVEKSRRCFCCRHYYYFEFRKRERHSSCDRSSLSFGSTSNTSQGTFESLSTPFCPTDDSKELDACMQGGGHRVIKINSDEKE